jgi:hypothetical protein
MGPNIKLTTETLALRISQNQPSGLDRHSAQFDSVQSEHAGIERETLCIR